MTTKYPGFTALMDYEQDNDSRTRIINAAIYSFSQQGFLQSTTKNIALVAEVSEALIFKQFSSKAKLLEAVFLEIIEVRLPAIFEYGMQDMAQKMYGAKDPKAFAAFFALKFRYMVERSGYFKIVFQELGHNETEALANIRGLMAKFFTKLEAVIRHLQMAGFLRGDLPPRTLFRSLSGMLTFYFLDTQVLQTPSDALDDEIERIISLFLKGAQNHEG